MQRRFPVHVTVLVVGLLLGCPKPDSVPLGEACKDPVECKDPADQCVTALGKQRCTMVCSKKDKCPQDFVCAKMDVNVRETGQVAGEYVGKQGYCLPKAEVPPRAVTL